MQVKVSGFVRPDFKKLKMKMKRIGMVHGNVSPLEELRISPNVLKDFALRLISLILK